MKRRGFLGALAATGFWSSVPGHAAELAPWPGWRPFVVGSEAVLRRAEAGRPFVLAFWSADCPPCRDELALWVKVQAGWPKLRIVLVCTDYGEDLVRAETLLAQTGAQRLEHWVFADEHAERLRWSIDPGWRGELPMARFYDQGHRVEGHRGRLDAFALDGILRRIIGSLK